MNIWIRSQNKEELINTRIISVVEKKIVNVEHDDDYTILGTYESKEKSIKVLDEIQKFIITQQKMLNDTDRYNTECIEYVFDMPAI